MERAKGHSGKREAHEVEEKEVFNELRISTQANDEV